MFIKYVTQGYMIVVALLSLASLAYVYAFPPASMLASRDGVPHFTPRVAHPETGEPVSVEDLIRNYRGD